MTPSLDKTLRHGGMSRRGFLRAMGFTTAAVAMPGLVGPRFSTVPIQDVIVWPFYPSALNMVLPIKCGKTFAVRTYLLGRQIEDANLRIKAFAKRHGAA